MAQAADELVEIDLSELDGELVGREMEARDFLLLAVLGLVVPAVLLVWGWL